MTEAHYRAPLRIGAVGLVSAVGAGLLCSWSSALAIAPLSMAPLVLDWAWTAFGPAADDPVEHPPEDLRPVKPPRSDPAQLSVVEPFVPRSGKPATGSAWNDELPELIAVFEGLSQNIILDINRASQRFIVQLGEIENQILATNTLQENALDSLAAIDRKAQDHINDRQHLDQSIANALAFGKDVRDELASTRGTLRGVVDIIQKLQGEISQIDRVAKSVNMLAVNAGIEATRAGNAGTGFMVIARDIRALASETQGLTDRVNPLTERIRKTVEDFARNSESSGLKDVSIDARLKDQARVLDELRAILLKVVNEHEGLIASQRNTITGSRTAGVEIERAIRMSLSTAQYGDILRQQLETIINGMSDVREIASSTQNEGEIRSRLRTVLEKLSELYVMSAQRKAHAASVTSDASSAAVAYDCEQEPVVEMF